MDIRHLRHFVAVARELHFGRAARRLRMEQAPLSQSIRRMEERLGVALFERSLRGGTRLTHAGTVLLRDAPAIVDAFDQAVSKVKALTASGRESLSVGFITAGALSVLPAALKSFKDAHETVDLTLHEARSAELIEQVGSGRSDLALVNPPSWVPRNIELIPLINEPTLVALPLGHALAAKRRIGLAAFADHPLIMFPRASNPDLHDMLMEAFEEAALTPRIEQEARLTPTILSLVAAEVGLALVPESARALPMRNVTFRPLKDEAGRLRWQLHVAVRREAGGAALRAFIDHLHDAAGPYFADARAPEPPASARG